MAIGLLISASACAAATIAYRPSDGAAAYRRYAISARIVNIAHSTSLRSATHATDSTCVG